MKDETVFNQHELRRQFNNQGKVTEEWTIEEEGKEDKVFTIEASSCFHEEIEFLEEDQELISDGCLVMQKFICKDCGAIARREWVIPDELEWDNGDEEE
tara:strand:- start:532 stop:828 length:297 start_codon:yes stop_codon:yes gene_type:complete